MLKTLKVVRTLIVNLGMIVISVYALAQGGDATIIGGVGLVSLAAYNGVEYADYRALVQAIFEVQNAPQDSDSNGSDGD